MVSQRPAPIGGGLSFCTIRGAVAPNTMYLRQGQSGSVFANAEQLYIQTKTGALSYNSYGLLFSDFSPLYMSLEAGNQNVQSLAIYIAFLFQPFLPLGHMASLSGSRFMSRSASLTATAILLLRGAILGQGTAHLTGVLQADCLHSPLRHAPRQQVLRRNAAFLKPGKLVREVARVTETLQRQPLELICWIAFRILRPAVVTIRDDYPKDGPTIAVGELVQSNRAIFENSLHQIAWLEDFSGSYSIAQLIQDVPNFMDRVRQDNLELVLGPIPLDYPM